MDVEHIESKQDIGHQGEDVARKFLEGRGYNTLEVGFRAPFGEIDLIMERGKTIVFVEVKKRRTDGYGAPEEAVTRHKQNHMTKAAWTYIQSRRLENRPIQFDIVSVSSKGIKHIPDAFWTSGQFYV